MGAVKKGIYRDSSTRLLGGVCSGLSYYLNIDRVFLRLGFIACVFAAGFTIPLYIILWAVIPKARTDKEKAEMNGISFDYYESSNFQSEPSAPKKAKPSAKSKLGLNGTGGDIFLYLVLLFCSIGLSLVVGFSFSVPLVIDVFRDVDFVIITTMRNSLHGVLMDQSALSMSSIATIGKFAIPFIAGIAFVLKNLKKVNVPVKVFNYLGITWICCVLLSCFLV